MIVEDYSPLDPQPLTTHSSIVSVSAKLSSAGNLTGETCLFRTSGAFNLAITISLRNSDPFPLAEYRW